ncbi:hypothetical protein SAMN02910355_2238 [Terrisporobacter glycolicus]|nr:hypothetical protein SAMN02910355_2238 [Terrisporobacter glycolicus]
MNKLIIPEKGICYLCEHVSNLNDDNTEICLCGCASEVNGKVKDVKAEITWTCEKCGNKVKDIKRIDVI